jgi:hypothetical protein
MTMRKAAIRQQSVLAARRNEAVPEKLPEEGAGSWLMQRRAQAGGKACRNS